MREFLKKYDLVMRLGSLVLAVFLWILIMVTENPIKEQPYNGIRTVVVGESELRENGLMITSGKDTLLNIRVNAYAQDVATMDQNRIYARVDVSGITKADTYQLDYELHFDNPQRLVTPVQQRPSRITLTVDEIITKEVPVTVHQTHDAPDGYRYQQPILVNDTVLLEGPKTLLETVETAQAILDTQDVTDRISKQCDYLLLDGEGNEVDQTLIQRIDSDTEKIVVTMVVYKIKTVPVSVNFIESDDVTADMATITFDPAEIEVYGRANEIDKLEAVYISEEIDLETVQTETEHTFRLDLPNNVMLMPGQPASVNAVVRINGMVSKSFRITNITPSDMNESETLYQSEVLTGEVEIMVRGPYAELNNISLSDILVEAVFDSSVLGEGIHDVPVTVTILEDREATIISQTETVSIRLALAPAASEADGGAAGGNGS